MSIVYTPDSAEARERVKWEAQHTVAGPGQRPYIRRDYPAVYYRAARRDGQLQIVETAIAESVDQGDQLIAREFHHDPNSAYAAVSAQEREIATLAAERNFHERRMSPAAQAEAAEANAATHGHLASLPPRPIRRRPRTVMPVIPAKE